MSIAKDASQYFNLVFRQRVSLEAESEEGRYICKIEGRILCAQYEGDNIEATRNSIAGRVIAYRVFGARAVADGVDLFEECDAYHQITLDFYRALFGDGPDFSDEIEEMFPHVFNPDFLILDLIEIQPRFRGRGLGLLTARRVMDLFEPEAGIVACKPFPLQFDVIHERLPPERKALGLDSFLADEQQAYDALRKYWSRLGFRRIGDSDYFALTPLDDNPSFEMLSMT